MPPLPTTRKADGATILLLARWQRWVTTALGAGLTGSGLWTVMVQGRDALAPVVLLICGVVCLLLAVVGVIPQSFSVKDLSYTLRGDERAVAERVVDRLPASALLELATASPNSEVAEESGGAPTPVREAVTDAARRSVVLRTAAVDRVAKAWSELYQGRAAQFSADEDYGPFDVAIPIESDGTLWLEVRLQRVTDAQVVGWQGQLGGKAALLVICQEEPTLSASLLMRDPPIMYTTSDASMPALTQTLDRLVKHVQADSRQRTDTRRKGLDS